MKLNTFNLGNFKFWWDSSVDNFPLGYWRVVWTLNYNPTHIGKEYSREFNINLWKMILVNEPISISIVHITRMLNAEPIWYASSSDQCSGFIDQQRFGECSYNQIIFAMHREIHCNLSKYKRRNMSRLSTSCVNARETGRSKYF